MVILGDPDEYCLDDLQTRRRYQVREARRPDVTNLN